MQVSFFFSIIFTCIEYIFIKNRDRIIFLLLTMRDFENRFRLCNSHPRQTGFREVKTPPLTYKMIANMRAGVKTCEFLKHSLESVII